MACGSVNKLYIDVKCIYVVCSLFLHHFSILYHKIYIKKVWQSVVLNTHAWHMYFVWISDKRKKNKFKKKKKKHFFSEAIENACRQSKMMSPCCSVLELRLKLRTLCSNVYAFFCEKTRSNDDFYGFHLN